MGTLVRRWTVEAKTPLGDISRGRRACGRRSASAWPPTFRSPSLGPKHVQIYNDGYWPICGAKHPHSLGQDFSECWLGLAGHRRAIRAGARGQTSYLENHGCSWTATVISKETFFTFSFSPIQDETGKVGGLFHPVTETTSKMLAERRTRALRDLAPAPARRGSLEEAFTLAAQSLRSPSSILPFPSVIRDDQGHEARLVAGTGLAAGTGASPRVVDLALLKRRLAVERSDCRSQSGPGVRRFRRAVAAGVGLIGLRHCDQPDTSGPWIDISGGISSRLPRQRPGVSEEPPGRRPAGLRRFRPPIRMRDEPGFVALIINGITEEKGRSSRPERL